MVQRLVNCGSMRLECSLKYLIIIMTFLDYLNNGDGQSIQSSPKNVMLIHLHSELIEDEKLPINQSTTTTDFTAKNLNDEFVIETNINKTFFRAANNSIVTSQVGSTVHLPCKVHLMADELVSWIRRKDYRLLTVGMTTYSSDERFSVVHHEEEEDWRLKIKFVQLRDAGYYECAISTHPSISLFMRLDVTESRAEIDGPLEKYIKPGSTLKLTCRVLQSIESPLFLFWYHNSRMINFDSHRGINVTIDSDNKYSELLILQTSSAHSGNFTCFPSNAAAASTFVHIFNGENPYGLAAYGAAVESKKSHHQSIYLLSMLVLAYQFAYMRTMS